jgi:hypothetical protein
MATENQNFFKHDDDTFSLVFSVTDVNEDLGEYYASWYVTSTTDLTTPLLEKNTDGAFSGATANIGDITISGVTITVAIDQNDYGSLPVGTYYHELTIGSLQNGDDSVVVASGEWEIKEAAFNHR